MKKLQGKTFKKNKLNFGKEKEIAIWRKITKLRRSPAK